jgi:hypothetical protein
MEMAKENNGVTRGVKSWPAEANADSCGGKRGRGVEREQSEVEQSERERAPGQKVERGRRMLREE